LDYQDKKVLRVIVVIRVYKASEGPLEILEAKELMELVAAKGIKVLVLA